MKTNIIKKSIFSNFLPYFLQSHVLHYRELRVLSHKLYNIFLHNRFILFLFYSGTPLIRSTWATKIRAITSLP